jgi:hypothetical protein
LPFYYIAKAISYILVYSKYTKPDDNLSIIHKKWIGYKFLQNVYMEAAQGTMGRECWVVNE